MTKKKNNLATAKSKCCFADVKLGGIGDFRSGDKAITIYYMCTKCGYACESIIVSRKKWERKPQTQIEPDKREKIKKKIINKEIKENE